MDNSNANPTTIAIPGVEPTTQVFAYWHRNRAIVLIPATSADEANAAFQRQYGSLNPVQSNVLEV